MGLDCSSCFFGTYVHDRSPLGEQLRHYIDRHGGTPAPIPEAPGLEVDMIGDTAGPTRWLTLQVSGYRVQPRGGGDVSPPRSLSTDPEELAAWSERVRTFLKGKVMSSHVPQVGWYFAETIG